MINLAKNTDQNDFLDVYNVRIRPSNMVFKDAFEGRTYCDKISIQNIGSSKVVIRILSPTSYAMQIKCNPRGQVLSPGLSLVRTIQYTFSFVNCEDCQIPIYINEERYDYQIRILASVPEISIFPTFVDFGIIDAGSTSAIRILCLINSGSTMSKFYVDLPKQASQPQLIAEPSRGKILPRSTIEIKIKLVSYKDGDIDTEIWIKCSHPIRIPVRARIVLSRFESIHPNATESFTIISFPPTYYGVKTTQCFMVRNFSSCCNMFYVMGDVRKNTMTWEQCADILYYYKYFKVFPGDGRFEPNETKLFQCIFQPERRKRREKFYPYFMVAFQICGVRCQDLVAHNFPDGVFVKQELINVASLEVSAEDISTLISEVCPVDERPTMLSTSQVFDLMPRISQFSNNFLKVYLHAEVEEPSVEVVPDELMLHNLTFRSRCTRVLEFTNNSRKLPIIMHYAKVPYVEVEKESIFLEPLEKIQIAVYITPQKLGFTSTRIVYELLFYDFPKEENKYSIIGSVSAVINFDTTGFSQTNSTLFKKFNSNYLKSANNYKNDIRFKNVLFKSKIKIAPFRTTSESLMKFAADMTQHQPRESKLQVHLPHLKNAIDIEENVESFALDNEFQNKVNAFYYQLRIQNSPFPVSQNQYLPNPLNDLSNKIKAHPHGSWDDHAFIPLTPAQMSNVTITPTFIDTGEIAENYNYAFKIWAINKNPFPIRIFVRPDKTNIIFPKGNRREIQSNTESDIPVMYITGEVGYYIVSLHILVNECLFITATVLANVVPATISIGTEQIVLDTNTNYFYVDLKNSLNLPISFFWHTNADNFTIHPRRGVIPSQRYTTCLLRNFTHVSGMMATDLDLKSGERDKFQRIHVLSTITPGDPILVTKTIEFKNMSLNKASVRTVVIKNPYSYSVGYRILDNELNDILTVAPQNGVIPAFAQSTLVFSMKITHCVKFRCRIKIQIVNSSILEVPIEGDVVYPQLSISPKMIQFKKVIVSTSESICFTLTNVSSSDLWATFNMSEHEEYRITETKCYWDPIVDYQIILQKRESKSFYLHFIPLEMTSSSFFLPVQINGIIGPPILTDPITSNLDYYLTEIPIKSNTISLPARIQCVKVSGYAVEPKILLSKIDFNFENSSISPRFSRLSDKLTITNPQKVSEDVCIRTSQLIYPFQIEHCGGKPTKQNDNSIVVSLGPKEQTVLNILFQPENYCEKEALLPLYLKSDNSFNYHSMIFLSGNYKKPVIQGEKTILYSRPYPLEYTSVSSKMIKFINHRTDCKIFSYTDLSHLTIEIKQDAPNVISDTEYELECIFKTRFLSNSKFCNKIRLYCSCSSEWECKIIGCAENCLLTCYAFADTFLPDQLATTTVSYHQLSPTVKASKMSLFDEESRRVFIEEEFQTSNFFTTYPFFPFDGFFDELETEKPVLTTFLMGVVDAVETWFHNQVMFGSTYYMVPGGISVVSYIEINKKSVYTTRTSVEHQKEKACVVPLVEGLINLVGKQIQNVITVSPVPEDEVERVHFIYTIYDKVIKFLEQLGAYFTYLRPEYLLEFSMFEVYKKYLFPKEQDPSPITKKIHSMVLFYHIAKQSWCDLLLQTYKVLYLSRLREKSRSVSSVHAGKFTPMTQYMSSIKDLTRNSNIFNRTEVILINWLEYHYNFVKVDFWSTLCHVAKEVNFFGRNLDDGLVFAAVTVTYCPYLSPQIRGMYLYPITNDQLYHNNITLLKCWSMINCSLKVTIEDLIKPNCIKLLMLVAYLYEVLPFMYPTEAINFTAGLSASTSVTMNIKNTNNFCIAYKPIFFGNERGYFSIDEEIILIAPKSTKSIVLTFCAKFSEPVKVYFLLSGECRGYHYARNKCVTLIGTSDLSLATSTVHLRHQLYTTVQQSLQIQSPYPINATYLIKYTCDDEVNFKSLNKLRYSHEYTIMGAVRIFLQTKQLYCDDNGLGEVNVLVTTIIACNRIIKVYFINPEIGDFMVKIISVIVDSKEVEQLSITLPPSLTENTRRIYVEIPHLNTVLWRALLDFIMQTSAGCELEYWKTHGKTTVGMRLLRRLLTDEDNLLDRQYMFCNATTYKINLKNKMCDLKLPDEVTIEDECTPGFVRIPLVFKSTDRNLPQSLSFTLTNSDGTSKRNYVVNFIRSNKLLFLEQN